MFLGKPDEVEGFCSPELVDALVIIADHRQPAVSQEQIDDFVLDVVGVLKFVDEDVLEILLIAFSDLGKPGKEVPGQEQDVIEIDRIAAFEQFVIPTIDLALPGQLPVELEVVERVR